MAIPFLKTVTKIRNITTFYFIYRKESTFIVKGALTVDKLIEIELLAVFFSLAVFRKLFCFVMSVEMVDLSSRMLILSGVGGEPPQRFATAGSHLPTAPTGVSHIRLQSTYLVFLKILWNKLISTYNCFKTTKYAKRAFALKCNLENLEVISMLSKHNSIQRDQIEMIALDQLAMDNFEGTQKIFAAMNFKENGRLDLERSSKYLIKRLEEAHSCKI